MQINNHLLETLVLYNYPEVSGKSAAPIKGSKGRFASEFFTRSTLSVEQTIADILISCLEKGWTCLWSYSSSGVANIENILRMLDGHAASVEIFKAKYSYKPQGRKTAKPVDEFVIYIESSVERPQ